MKRTGLILASIISLCVAGNVEARNAHLKAGRGGVEHRNPLKHPLIFLQNGEHSFVQPVFGQQ